MAQPMVEIENQSDRFHKIPHEHVEKWQGTEVRIPAGKRIQMRRSEAIKFVGQYYPITLDGNEELLDSKALKIIDDGKGVEAGPSFISQLDGKDYGNQEALDRHYKAVKSLADRQSLKDEIVSELGKDTQSAGRAAYRCPHQNCTFETESGPGLLRHQTVVHGKPAQE